MTVLSKPKSKVRRRFTECDIGDVYLERTDIRFHNVDPDHVRIEFTVTNRGPGRSRPTRAKLRSAPLGAFVPWTPLETVVVPGLDAGESTDISAVVPRPATAPAGFFDDNPPPKLTALREDDNQKPSRPNSLIRMLLRIFRPLSLRRNTDQSEPTEIPALLGDTMPHWAGNINVLMDNKDVERHMASALRVHPGRTNLAMFFVGDRRPDQFMFEIKGAGIEWESALYYSANFESLLKPQDSIPIRRSDWLTLDTTEMLLLAFRPPRDCQPASLDVHVTRRSTGQTAIVEFSFDPTAQGPGCYTV